MSVLDKQYLQTSRQSIYLYYCLDYRREKKKMVDISVIS